MLATSASLNVLKTFDLSQRERAEPVSLGSPLSVAVYREGADFPVNYHTVFIMYHTDCEASYLFGVILLHTIWLAC